MKNTILLVLTLVFTNILVAQNNAIKITNLETSEVKVLEEGQRIRVTTTEGKKHSGKLDILDDGSIMVHFTKLRLDEIEKMKWHPWAMTAIQSVFFVYVGSIVFLGSIAVGLLGEPLAFIGIIPGGAMLYGGITGINVLQGYHIADGYRYELVRIEN